LISIEKAISFFIPGISVPQGRPRVFVNQNTGRPVVYDPKKSKDWKGIVSWHARQNWTGEILQGPIEMALVFHLQRPKSLPKKVRFHMKRPDLDNLTKAVKDGMKGIIYRDDSQVILMHLGKRYGNTPGVSVRIRECDQDAEIIYLDNEFGWIDFASPGGVNERAGTEDLFAGKTCQQDRSRENPRDQAEDPPEENQKDRTPALGSAL